MKGISLRIDAMYRQIDRDYAPPVDELMNISVLDKARYDAWRARRTPFLKVVYTANFHRLSELLRKIRSFAFGTELKPSISSYTHKEETAAVFENRQSKDRRSVCDMLCDGG